MDEKKNVINFEIIHGKRKDMRQTTNFQANTKKIV